MSDDPMRRIDAKCIALADQNWRALEDRLPDVVRIGMHGPQPEDAEFVRRVFVLLGYELTQRKAGAK